MVKSKAMFKAIIAENQEMIVIEKIGPKLNNADKELMIEFGFAPWYWNKHMTKAYNTRSNMVKLYQLGCHISIQVSEEIDKIYRTIAPEPENSFLNQEVI